LAVVHQVLYLVVKFNLLLLLSKSLLTCFPQQLIDLWVKIILISVMRWDCPILMLMNSWRNWILNIQRRHHGFVGWNRFMFHMFGSVSSAQWQNCLDLFVSWNAILPILWLHKHRRRCLVELIVIVFYRVLYHFLLVFNVFFTSFLATISYLLFQLVLWAVDKTFSCDIIVMSVWVKFCTVES
jgi:hypothetical protein